MIDPFTAFAMAQGAVAGIKKAVALGKDINGLIGDFSKFYQAADHVHIASTKKRIESIKKSDSQISADALEIAMKSKALREYERELKDILIWSGNADVYNEMMMERTRMAKERAAAELFEEQQKQKQREALYSMFLNGLLLIGMIAILVPLLTIVWQVITK